MLEPRASSGLEHVIPLEPPRLVSTSVDKLNGKLAAAQQAGALQTFNRAYKAYRLDCVARGERAMPYGTALAKLRGLLAGAAAGAPTANMLQAVFKPSELDP